MIDVDRFIDSKRSAGYKPRSLASVCVALRYFLRFTESHGWTPSRLSATIKSPRVRRYDSQTRGPSWKDVRKLLDGCGHGKADIRARAIMLLCAIYALRASEVANLSLSDFDWTEETVTIRRAKSRVAQRFPLQFEVGEAILEYLQGCRPRCFSSLLFVTLSPPYRRVCVASIGDIIRDRMKRLKIHAPSMGAHSLRHSCATELLRKGVPLANIADFLGHQDLSSVSVYAKCSPRSLKDVASVSLVGLL
jgi:integrase/recombinase XerD